MERLAPDIEPLGLSRVTIFGWGVGTLGPALMWQVTNVYLLSYIVDIAGFAAGVAGSFIFISKLYDAVTDALMGVLSDRTRSRFGRRRPYILLGGVMLALSGVFLFSLDNTAGGGASSLLLLAGLILFSTSVTVFNIPYLAMPADMTTNRNDFSALMSVRVQATGITILLASFVPVLIDAFGGGGQGYQAMSLLLGAVILASSAACFFLTKQSAHEADTPPQGFKELLQSLSTLKSNAPYLILVATKFFWLTALSFTSASPFFFFSVLGLKSIELTLYFLIFAVGMILAPFIVRRFLVSAGAGRLFQVCLLASAALYVSWMLVDANDHVAQIYVRAALFGFFAGGALLAGQTMLPETMVFDRTVLGGQREGVLSGFYTTVEKISAAVGLGLIGLYLQSQGYVSGLGVGSAQTSAAMQAIVISMSVFPACAALAAAVIVHFYDRQLRTALSTTRMAQT